MRLPFDTRVNIGCQYVTELLEPRSPYGRELQKRLSPCAPSERQELERELDNVELIFSASPEDSRALDGILRLLGRMKDVRRPLDHCANGTLSEVELFELRHFVLLLSQLRPLFLSLAYSGQLHGISFPSMDEVLAILDPEGNRMLSFYIEDTRTPGLLAARREKRRLNDMLRSGSFEGSRDSLEAERTAAAAAEDAEEQAIRAQMSEQLRPQLDMLSGCVSSVAALDLSAAKAKLARKLGAVRPVITEGELSLTGAFSPKIKQHREEAGGSFTPLTMAPPMGVTVVTGANMGGKSVALKTVALNVYLASLGFFVFAESAKIPLFDSIHIISEDLEAADRGLSSFGGEITRFGEVCDDLDAGSFALIVMDEFARGTNSEEGAAIVRATVKYLQRRRCIAILATHFDGASRFAAAHYQTAGLRGLDLSSAPTGAGVEYIGSHMDYGLYPVAKDAQCPRDAVAICRLLNMRQELLDNIE